MKPRTICIITVCAALMLCGCIQKRDIAGELPSAPAPAATAESAPVIMEPTLPDEGAGDDPLAMIPAGAIETRIIDEGAVCTPISGVGYEITGGLVELVVTGTALSGTVRTTDGGSVRVTLTKGARLLAQFETEAMLDLSVSLDAESQWTLQGETRADAVVNGDRSFANVVSNGFDLYYNAESAENAYLNRATIAFAGGGALTPMI